MRGGDQAMGELKNALTFLDDMPRMPKAISRHGRPTSLTNMPSFMVQGVVSVAQMDEAVREREAHITVLTQEVQLLQKRVPRFLCF